MKTAFALAALAFSAAALAKGPDSYQVTGPVSALTPEVITVMKGKEKFEIARDPADKTDVKVGDKVTVKYTMSEVSLQKK